MAGFWSYAQQDPDYVAIVDPDGTENRAGDVLARANQLVHTLRALGLEQGDTVAAILPNGRDPMHVYLAALQAGWYYVPINYRLSPPEVAYILQDSEAKVFISHERFADLASAAAEEAGIPAANRLGHGDIPGFRSFDELVDPQPTTMPENRSAGAAMHYTSGTTGKPKGVEARALGHRPGHERGAVHVPARDLRHHPRRRQRAPLHLAELPHRGHDVRGQLVALEAHRRVHGPLGSGGSAAADRALRRDPHAHGADAVHPHVAAARRRPVRSTTSRR